MVVPTEAITITPEIEVIDAVELPTRTYHLDFKKGCCTGFIDGQKAMEQAIFKALNTIRFEHLIYTNNYGFQNMVGYDELYVRGDLARRIHDAILQDERITSLENFSLEFTSKEDVLVTFIARTIYGDVSLLKEAIRIA
ncbi:DUF2634 domain-containing protein [Lysinibacillus sp. ACHW1.5]|uniref:DUF2634 domain-containing protein n=1 Tax=Lysinibacillus sp. ACHW1.5 TaxID=2913506 RepID=UPI001EDB3BAC|nr:DUF2634 domain-containing protein [Lysinibacillus sp. ACHW1.5]UKJ43444.1 DUF2634 domain-containing protein [Lysinibacillus sp. ACHW1.5]